MHIRHVASPSAAARFAGKRTRRLGAGIAAMLALVLGLAACAGNDSSSGHTDSASDTSITITHQFGETEISGVPSRPVTIGASWADALVKLDVPIVGEFVAQAGADGSGKPYAWTPEHEAEVFSYDVGTMPSAEQVAALKPDVILVGALSDKSVYEQYSKIAPVVPVMASGVVLDSWQDVTTTAGKIFGKEKEAKAAVHEVETLLADTKKEFPAVEGKTFAYGQLTPTNEIGVVTSPTSPAATLLSDVGLTLYPDVESLSSTGERQVVSPERIDVLSADVLVFWPLAGGKDAFKSVAGWDELPAVQNDTTLYLDNDTAAAFVTPTIYSVPWAVNKLKPVLANLK